MRKYIILMALAALFAASCNKDENPGGKNSKGGVSISFSTSGLQTKASLGDGVVSDGGGIALDGDPQTPDLCILLFNSAGVLKAYYPNTANSDRAVAEIVETGTGASAKSLTVTFNATADGGALEDDTYSVFALANTQGLWALTDGTSTYSSWSNVLSALKAGSNPMSISTLQSLKFSALGAGQAPQVGSSRLPMSAVGAVSVLSGRGQATAELIRCVGKLNVTVENMTGAALKISGLRLGNFNPDRGYLLPQEGSALPSDLQYSGLTLINSEVASETCTILADTTQQIVTDCYLFPGAAGKGNYSLDITFGDPYYRNVYTMGSLITLGVQEDTKEYFIYYENGYGGVNNEGFACFDNSLSGTKMGVTKSELDSDDNIIVPQGPEYRWRFEAKSDGTASDCRYNIKNVGTGDYIKTNGSALERAETNVAGHYAYFVTSAGKTATADFLWRMETGGKANKIFCQQVGDMEGYENEWFGITLSRGTRKEQNSEDGAYVHTANNAYSKILVYEAIASQSDFVANAPIRNKLNEDIGSLDRNQNLDIYVKVAGNGVKIPFNVEVWTQKTENVHFD